MSVPITETTLVYALVGNPNCGKSTLFNALTGLRQKVGNYPGVTVEKKVGECFSQHGRRLRIIDLPGSYSLNARSPDEAVMRDVLLGRSPGTARPDRIVCVVDASNLDRHLYLVTQILELGLPVIVALNMIDVAVARHSQIDSARLSERLGVPVVATQASTRSGIIDLKLVMSRDDLPVPHGLPNLIPVPVRGGLLRSRQTLADSGIVRPEAALLEPLYLLAGHDPTHYGLTQAQQAQIQACGEQLEREVPGWEDQLVTARYEAIAHICQEVIRRPSSGHLTLTDRLDAVLLHRFWGWVSLAVFMGLIFFLIFSVATVPQGWIEDGFAALGEWIRQSLPAGDLRELLTDGVLAGVSGVLVFLPQILILFFFIGLMEDTGYMARLAFIMDRVMGKVGLNGRSFLPLLSSYACAVPGVLATRTIDSAKDRLVTILVVPLASCSARLPVYVLLVGLFIAPTALHGWGAVLAMIGLYALGTGGAFFFAWLFHRRLLRGASSPMILELPGYKLPSLLVVLRQMFERAWLFVRRAGTIILGLSILLWAALNFPRSESAEGTDRIANSFGGRLGRFIEPVIQPMGADWKVGIGLIGAQAAREVFNSTLSVVYSVQEEGDDPTRLRDRLERERHPDGRPVFSGPMVTALLVYFVFAMQCLSTVAIVRRETGGWKWPLFQFAYMTGAGYLLAVAVFQIGRLLGY